MRLRPSENGLSDGLGRVDIQLLQRILRHKTADAGRKYEPMPPIAGICNAADAVLGRKSRQNVDC